MNCGQRLDRAQTLLWQAAQQVDHSVAANGGEVVIGIVPHLTKVVDEGILEFMQKRRYYENFGYTLVATNQRMILAQFSVQMMHELTAKKKAQAKGFAGKLLAGSVVTGNEIAEYSRKYLSMPPEQIVAETPGNVALDIASINRVNSEIQVIDRDEDGDARLTRYTLIIESKQGDYKFRYLANPQDMEVLRRALGDKVHGTGLAKEFKPLF